MVRASRTPTFKQAALMRAWKAAEAAGKDVVETRIGSDGKSCPCPQGGSAISDHDNAL